MSTETKFAFAFAAGSTTTSITLSTPVAWVAFGVVAVVGLFGAIAYWAYENGQTERARIKR